MKNYGAGGFGVGVVGGGLVDNIIIFDGFIFTKGTPWQQKYFILDRVCYGIDRYTDRFIERMLVSI